VTDLPSSVRRSAARSPVTECIAGDATIIRYAELTDCQLYKVGNEFSRKPYAIAVQQGSQLKDAISKA
jgi:ionotropic glutamate receptor